MISGFATSQGTEAFAKRFSEAFRNQFFRLAHGFYFSSLGLGTYLGNMDDETDQNSYEAAARCVKHGINVMDSAINYRAQRSERVIGNVFDHLIREGAIKREEIFISTKGGFIPFDRDYPKDPYDYFRKNYIETGILKPEEVVQECHAMTPRYLEDQLARSRRNLGFETIDLYYLHNPETQLEEISENEFYTRLATAFEFLEAKVKEGKIRMYGTATWSGYRTPRGEKGYLSLHKVLETAKKAGGDSHHFKAIQLPFNLAMAEAFTHDNQIWENESVSTLEYAKRAGLLVFTSGSLLQGRLSRSMPDSVKAFFSGLAYDSACALQFTRSAPGVTLALCGMKQKSHIEENLTLADIFPLSEEEFYRLFQRKG